MAIRVLVVDDHAVFLEGLVTLLGLEDDEIDVVGTALNGQEALELDRQLDPDVVLLDIKMPVLDGVEVARRLRARRSDVKIVMLTTFDDRSLIAGALSAGATSYLLKDAHAAEVILAIKRAYEGRGEISSELARKLSEAPVVPAADASAPASLTSELSRREMEVLELVGQGRTNQEISERLHLSEKTVRNYVSRIYDVLNVHSRTRAALWAADNLRSAPRRGAPDGWDMSQYERD